MWRFSDFFFWSLGEIFRKKWIIKIVLFYAAVTKTFWSKIPREWMDPRNFDCSSLPSWHCTHIFESHFPFFFLHFLPCYFCGRSVVSNSFILEGECVIHSDQSLVCAYIWLLFISFIPPVNQAMTWRCRAQRCCLKFCLRSWHTNMRNVLCLLSTRDIINLLGAKNLNAQQHWYFGKFGLCFGCSQSYQCHLKANA